MNRLFDSLTVDSQVDAQSVWGCRFRYLAKELRHGGPGVGHDDLEDSARRAGHGQEPAERLRRMGIAEQLGLADLTAKLQRAGPGRRCWYGYLRCAAGEVDDGLGATGVDGLHHRADPALHRDPGAPVDAVATCDLAELLRDAEGGFVLFPLLTPRSSSHRTPVENGSSQKSSASEYYIYIYIWVKFFLLLYVATSKIKEKYSSCSVAHYRIIIL